VLVKAGLAMSTAFRGSLSPAVIARSIKRLAAGN
jgi:hypothetical protein